MNDISEDSLWRRRIAEQIAKRYAENSKVDAVFLGGSSARGCADGHSDIELGVFWSEDPLKEERSKVVHSLDFIDKQYVGIHSYNADEELWNDDFYLGTDNGGNRASGSLVEVAHHKTEFIERVINEVTEEYNPDDLKQNLVAGVVDAIPFCGIEMIEVWISQAREYPTELARAVINRHAQIDHFWCWKMFLKRNENLLSLYSSFTAIEEKLLRILLALNGRYFCGFKWVYHEAQTFDIKPERFIERMRNVFIIKPEEADSLIYNLVDETYDLIEAHFPDMDVDRLRSIFHFKRQYWEKPPAAIKS